MLRSYMLGPVHWLLGANDAGVESLAHIVAFDISGHGLVEAADKVAEMSFFPALELFVRVLGLEDGLHFARLGYVGKDETAECACWRCNSIPRACSVIAASHSREIRLLHRSHARIVGNQLKRDQIRRRMR